MVGGMFAASIELSKPSASFFNHSRSSYSSSTAENFSFSFKLFEKWGCTVKNCNKKFVSCAVSSEVGSKDAPEKDRINSLGGMVTDETVPEGHKGLHGFLYGDSGADVHDSKSENYAARAGEDDGSSIIDLNSYVSKREGKKFAGVYAVYDKEEKLQYVGYSRNVVLSLKAHCVGLGEETCHAVRVQMYNKESLVSRQILDEQRQEWLNQWGVLPPGNGAELSSWEGPNGPGTAAMTEAERSEYDEKKLKMRKAMGENLYDDVEGETVDSKERRLRLLQATEGDDWSSVINIQTKATVAEEVPEQIVSPFARAGAPQFAPAGAQVQAPPELTVASVDETLNEVRPYLIADGGNVEVVAVENGVVMLRLQGACGTCPSSTATMKMGLEGALRNRFGDLVKEVLQVDKLDIGATLQAVDFFLDTLRPAIENFKGKVEVVSVDKMLGVCEIKYQGPPPVGMGVQAAVKDKFPDIRQVNLVGF